MSVDYVDIFYSHRVDPVTPIEETIGALDTLVRQGKALYVGISSYSAERTAVAAAVARSLGTPLVIHQPSYSILNRWVEDGLTGVLKQEGMGAIAFTPLAQGLLTDKYLGDGTADRAQQRSSLPQTTLSEHGLATLRSLDVIAKERGQTLAQLAIQWVLRDPVVASALIGASRTGAARREPRGAGRPGVHHRGARADRRAVGRHRRRPLGGVGPAVTPLRRRRSRPRTGAGKAEPLLRGRRRAGDGYHDVASAYQAVSLYEDVWAEPAADFSVSVSGTVDVSASAGRRPQSRAARGAAAGAADRLQRAACTSTSTSTSRWRAAWAADRRMPRPPSSRAMRCGEPTSARRELHRLAARLGADVPFALMGGTAIGTGRGDQLSPALAKGRFDWVVVPSGEGLSTPEVYAHLDALRGRHPDIVRGGPRPRGRPRRAAGAARRGSRRPRRARAQRPAGGRAVAAPALRDALELGEQSGALVGMVSGSGPTLAFLAGDPESALELQVVLSAAGYEALHVHGPVHGARVL